MPSQGFAPIFVIIGLFIFSMLIVGAYYLGLQQLQPQANITTTSVTPTQPTPSPNEKDSPYVTFKEIKYLEKYSHNNSASNRTVFITFNSGSHHLKLADAEMTSDSIKTLHSLDQGALSYSTPIYTIRKYLIANVSGGDFGDIMIFNSENGNTINSSVYQDNPELSSWIISYNGTYLGNDIIKINLFRIDNSQATADVDLKSGKVIANSLTTIK